MPTGTAVDHAPVIAMDALDRHDFDRLVERSAAVAELIGRGERLLPDWRALLRDVFAAHAKSVVELVDRDALPGSAALRHKLLSELTGDRRFVEFHRLTQLRPDNAGLATLRVGRELLRELKAGRLMLPRELRAQLAADAAERDLRELLEEAQSAHELAERGGGDPSLERALRTEASAMGQAAQVAQAALAGRQAKIEEAARQVPNESLVRMRGALDALKDRMQQAEETGHAPLPLPMEAPGEGDGGDAIAAMDLSDKLSANALLARLAKLIGAFRAEARAARRQKVPRARTEIYGLTRGDDLARLLPHELLSMRHPVLRRDFRRRLLERQLMSYRTRGDDREGRGPAVLCLDVSGSMAGGKAVWAKAVALTLADWARRQHREVTVLTFSSGPGGVRRHPLVGGPARSRRSARRPLFKRKALLTFAEETVGGGTDFGPPLSIAREIISAEARFKRGDIVLITDGAAELDLGYVEEFSEFRRSHDCRCLGVVIDVADHRQDTLARLCDGIVKVSDLDANNARAVFAAFDR